MWYCPIWCHGKLMDLPKMIIIEQGGPFMEHGYSSKGGEKPLHPLLVKPAGILLSSPHPQQDHWTWYAKKILEKDEK